ncbi:MAG: CDGSH iron-sulfur domain-containing protein [Candidatus Rokubacteria bacterium]|nr:CDGSH iron-sulfur domain-containing protein [Candidatus Rokubacteria bacterium]
MAATVTPLGNGPLMVKGEVEVVDAQGKRLPAQGDAIYYLCRKPQEDRLQRLGSRRRLPADTARRLDSRALALDEAFGFEP